jgi:hypothetical protein
MVHKCEVSTRRGAGIVSNWLTSILKRGDALNELAYLSASNNVYFRDWNSGPD